MLKFEIDVIDLSSFVQQLASQTRYDFSAKRDKSDWRANQVTITIPKEEVSKLLKFLVAEYDEDLTEEDLIDLYLVKE